MIRKIICARTSYVRLVNQILWILTRELYSWSYQILKFLHCVAIWICSWVVLLLVFGCITRLILVSYYTILHYRISIICFSSHFTFSIDPNSVHTSLHTLLYLFHLWIWDLTVLFLFCFCFPYYFNQLLKYFNKCNLFIAICTYLSTIRLVYHCYLNPFWCSDSNNSWPKVIIKRFIIFLKIRSPFLFKTILVSSLLFLL